MCSMGCMTNASCNHPIDKLVRSRFYNDEPRPTCTACGQAVSCPHPRYARDVLTYVGGDTAIICRLCGPNPSEGQLH
jgi:hypothetical protein